MRSLSHLFGQVAEPEGYGKKQGGEKKAADVITFKDGSTVPAKRPRSSRPPEASLPITSFFSREKALAASSDESADSRQRRLYGAGAAERVTMAQVALQSSGAASGHEGSTSQLNANQKAGLESRDAIRRKLADAAALRMGTAWAGSAASEPGRGLGHERPPFSLGGKSIHRSTEGTSEHGQGTGAGMHASRALESEVINLIDSD